MSRRFTAPWWRRPRWPSLLPAALALPGLLCVATGQAAPRTPADDQEVIERLPARLPGSAPRRLIAAPLGTPAPAPTLPAALMLSRQAIDQARRSGDPRDWGLAQAALAPWWGSAQTPAPVRLLRATIRQGQHDFAGALSDLDGLLAEPIAEAVAGNGLRRASLAAPRAAGWAMGLGLRAQAELTRASIHQVQGRYAVAREACERLAGEPYAALGQAVRVAARACLAELDQLQGRTPAARADAALAALGPRDEPWLALLRAEMAARNGRPEAGPLFAVASSGEAPSLYALAARADWLLDNGRAAEAEQLLRDYEAADALLLRRAIALQHLSAGSPKAAAELAPLVAQLQARFDAALARGDHSHAREQARFALELQGDSPAALELATSNWAWQREPADALLLLRAAAAAGQPAAGAPAIEWAREQGFTDLRWPPGPRDALLGASRGPSQLDSNGSSHGRWSSASSDSLRSASSGASYSVPPVTASRKTGSAP
jgi:hypothetical protein